VPAVGLYYWTGSAWVQLSAGALSGSGTTNYVAKWTSASAIGNSQIYDNGTYVGINTATPGQRLEVQGNIKLDDNMMVEGNSSARVYRNLVTYSDNTSGSAGIFIINTTMPWNSPCMFTVRVEGYFYDATGPFETSIGAYMYTDNNFYNKGYVNVGARNLPVRLGRNASGNIAIVLGTDGGNHEYPKISVTSYMQTYSSISEAAADGWTITRATNTSALTFVQTVSDITNANKPLVFNCTGADQTYVVPAGVTSLTVKMWGAGGGAGSYGGWNCGYVGGGGGYSNGTIAVTPGSTYYIVVGRGGQGGTSSQLATCYGGGGRSCVSSDCRYCGGGGGRSAFRNTANTADLMTAGGGGGGGATSGNNNYLHRGGAGGGATGQNGENQYNGSPYHGYGGSQVGGGAGGTGASRTGIAGSQYQGGYPGGAESYGGGGGGGWYGGGGGSYHSYMSGGGGGSGYISGAGVSNATTTTGNYEIPAGVSDPYYRPGVGIGGRGSGGGDGMVVIIPNY